MDFNRPDIDQDDRPSSSRSSSKLLANRDATESPPEDHEPPTKSALSEHAIVEESDDHHAETIAEIDQATDVNTQNSSAQNNQHDEKQANPELNREVTDDAVETDDPIEKTDLTEQLDANTIQPQSDSDLPSELEQNSQVPAEAPQSKDEKCEDGKREKHEQTNETTPQKKEFKRKPKPNKFADGNLIPEEGDDEQHERVAVRSPGPPPLEPISQHLDDSDKHAPYQRHDPEMLGGATTPDKIDITLDDDYQEVEVDVKLTREELIARHQAAVEERERLQNTNNQLHHKLADFFRKKKSEEAQNQPLFDKSSQEQEQRYMKYLSTIENLKRQIELDKAEVDAELEDIKYKCKHKELLVDKDRMVLTKLKRDAGLKSVSQSGRSMHSKELDEHLERERQKERDVIGVRVENIKLKNQLRKKELELKAKEEFGEGLHMIDFEQLKIENQTYNEKIEERNEELMKLKKKINNTVQILTHVKEKLKFVNAENDREKGNLDDYDQQVKQKRDVLNRTKQSRDSLRMDNARLKQSSGLLGNGVLLRDFEDCVDKNDSIESQIELLKRKHAELVLNSKGIKLKIAQAKSDK